MDIKAKIEEIVKKLQSDKTLLDKFQKNPVPTVESLIGVDLPDGEIDKVVTGIKAKIGADKVTNALGGLGKMFK